MIELNMVKEALIAMSNEMEKKYKQILQLRRIVLQAERERNENAETLSISEARKRLRRRINVAQ